VRPESAVAASKREPFFWISAAITVAMIGLIVWVIVRFGASIILVITAVVFAIWFLERGLNVARPNIRAHTNGPPARTLTWRTTHRYGLGRIENRIAAQIEEGQPEAEPSGSVLIGI